MAKANVYFVMYLVLLTELLVIITERDTLTKQELKIKRKMMASIGQSYKIPVVVNAQQGVSYVVGSSNDATVKIESVGLVSDEEKSKVQYTIKPVGSVPGWMGSLSNNTSTGPFSLKVDPKTGDATFAGKFSSAGKYQFDVFMKVDRVLPDYLPKKLYEDLEKQIGDKKHQELKTSFTVEVTTHNDGVKKSNVIFRD